MKLNTKHIGLCLLLGAAMSTTSCNDLLDLDPVYRYHVGWVER